MLQINALVSETPPNLQIYRSLKEQEENEQAAWFNDFIYSTLNFYKSNL